MNLLTLVVRDTIDPRDGRCLPPSSSLASSAVWMVRNRCPARQACDKAYRRAGKHSALSTYPVVPNRSCQSTKN
eukprot:7390227-Prymnesium_polylepis.1